MQVYSHPVFETVEAGMARLSPAVAARPLAARLVLRSLYVALTVVAAVLLPFIGDLMGIVRPLNFYCHPCRVAGIWFSTLCSTQTHGALHKRPCVVL